MTSFVVTVIYSFVHFFKIDIAYENSAYSTWYLHDLTQDEWFVLWLKRDSHLSKPILKISRQ